jgi:hypothetical protein
LEDFLQARLDALFRRDVHLQEFFIGGALNLDQVRHPCHFGDAAKTFAQALAAGKGSRGHGLAHKNAPALNFLFHLSHNGSLTTACATEFALRTTAIQIACATGRTKIPRQMLYLTKVGSLPSGSSMQRRFHAARARCRLSKTAQKGIATGDHGALFRKGPLPPVAPFSQNFDFGNVTVT